MFCPVTDWTAQELEGRGVQRGQEEGRTWASLAVGRGWRWSMGGRREPGGAGRWGVKAETDLVALRLQLGLARPKTLGCCPSHQPCG